MSFLKRIICFMRVVLPYCVGAEMIMLNGTFKRMSVIFFSARRCIEHDCLFSFELSDVALYGSKMSLHGHVFVDVFGYLFIVRSFGVFGNFCTLSFLGNPRYLMWR